MNDCQQECVNTPGSYLCGCMEGFELAADNKSCIGESGSSSSYRSCCRSVIVPCHPLVLTHCPMDNPCTQICVLVSGNQMCDCHVGYELESGSSTNCVG